MSLLDRLQGTEEPKIPVHQFQSALAEWEDESSVMGSTNAERRQRIIDAFQISADEEDELDWLKSRYTEAKGNDQTDRYFKVFDNVLLICEDEKIADTLGYGTKNQITTRLTEATQTKATTAKVRSNQT